MRVTRDGRWLEADLGSDHQVLSWAVHRPGFVTARRILWREVRDADLPLGFDVDRWLAGELAAREAEDAVVMLTSREISAHHAAQATVGGNAVDCLATVGLSNAERVGHRQAPKTDWGTINIAVQIHVGLTPPAMIEALTIAAQARTLAVIEAGIALPEGPATGTGTDCIALAAQSGQIRHAGLHTDLGEAIGRATHRAVSDGVVEWQRWLSRQRQSV